MLCDDLEGWGGGQGGVEKVKKKVLLTCFIVCLGESRDSFQAKRMNFR